MNPVKNHLEATPGRYSGAIAKATSPLVETESLESATIAELPDDCIKKMTTEELVRMIRTSEGLLPTMDSAESLCLRDRRCLIRLAFLARESTRRHLEYSLASSDSPPIARHRRRVLSSINADEICH